MKIRNAFIGLTSPPYLLNPTTLAIYQQDSCKSRTVSFTPQAGKDYEVVSYFNQYGCAVMVLDIQTREGKTVLVPIKTYY